MQGPNLPSDFNSTISPYDMKLLIGRIIYSTYLRPYRTRTILDIVKKSGESKTFFKKHVPKRRSTDIYKYKGKNH